MKIRTIPFVIATWILFSGCEKVIEFDDPGSEERLVINSFVRAGQQAKVSVFKSASILESGSTQDLFELTGAQIDLRANGESLNMIFDGIDGFVSEEIIDEEAFLSVEVSHPEYNTINATTQIPETAVAGDVVFEDDPDTSGASLSFTLTDPAETEDFYHIVLMERDGVNQFESALPFYTTNQYLADPELFESETYYYSGAFLSDGAFNGETITLDLNVTFLNDFPDTEFYVQVLKASEEYYLYGVSRNNSFEQSGGLFAQPVQVYSNIEDGYGVFGSYSVLELPFNE